MKLTMYRLIETHGRARAYLEAEGLRIVREWRPDSLDEWETAVALLDAKQDVKALIHPNG